VAQAACRDQVSQIIRPAIGARDDAVNGGGGVAAVEARPMMRRGDRAASLQRNGHGSGGGLLALMLAQSQPAQVLGSRREVLLLAAKIVNQFQPFRLYTQFEPSFLLRLFRAHGQLRSVRLSGKVMRRGSGVNPGYLSYPERYGKYELTGMYGKAYRQGINNTGAPMDFLFSPLAGLVASTILLPGPILPSFDDVVALVTPPAVEQPVSAPATKPSIDSLLTLPSGFRAPGYEALTIQRVRN
jgi:hypothetical protein